MSEETGEVVARAEGEPAAASKRASRREARPPRRSRHARNRLVILLNLLFSGALFVLLVAATIAYWGKSEFEGPGPLAEEASFVVPRNTSLESIANGLERQGIVSDARVFEYGARLSGAGGQLKAGEYAFAPGTSMRDVMEKLRSGSSLLYSISVPEGWTVQQAYDRIAAEDMLTGDLPKIVPEGTLRPDTYLVQRGMKRADLVAQMRAAQEKLVTEIWRTREADLPVKDVNEFVTLASIVERETGVPSERPHVASVFVNRLNKGMRLQSDPTIIYGIWGGAGKPADEPIRESHIKGKTPYNTYVIEGLPPGPIANPGRAALEAVARPLASDDLYFVADGTGGHVFAETLEAHNANVRRYRQLERRQDAEDQQPRR